MQRLCACFHCAVFLMSAPPSLWHFFPPHVFCKPNSLLLPSLCKCYVPRHLPSSLYYCLISSAFLSFKSVSWDAADIEVHKKGSSIWRSHLETVNASKELLTFQKEGGPPDILSRLLRNVPSLTAPQFPASHFILIVKTSFPKRSRKKDVKIYHGHNRGCWSSETRSTRHENHYRTGTQFVCEQSKVRLLKWSASTHPSDHIFWSRLSPDSHILSGKLSSTLYKTANTSKISMSVLSKG